MTVHGFALIFGLLYFAVGILGFIPAALTPPPPDAPTLAVTTLYGYLFGLFPVNVVHSGAHLLLGVWGVLSVRRRDAALLYAKALALIYGLLFVFGLVPALRTAFGLMPLHGHDVWLHAATALVAAYAGFGAPARRPA